ncbi:hypothetical protein PLICRDRAFT_86626 [Plicaturopsis crispa FD-325 SS-3]|nr:hypothetical protein PLICRDRAFT_86626 [Plicaturopsis crispa FD-325 SS-3]
MTVASYFALGRRPDAPRLTHLAVPRYPISVPLDARSLPSLTSFEYTYNTYYSATVLRAHGHKLTAVVLHVHRANALGAELGAVTEACPRLARLMLGLQCWDYFHPDIVLPSTITHLGLRSNPYRRAKASVYLAFFEALRGVAVPSLKTVQFYDSRDVARLRETSELCEVIASFSSSGFRLLDHDGKDL